MFKIEDITNKIICGDNLNIVKSIPSNSISTLVCDPPYGLEYMGKEWDKLGDASIEPTRDSAGGFLRDGKSGSNPYAATQIRMGSDTNSIQQWHYQWAKAMLRITKPGGFLLCFGGTRTHHRLTCAIEDAGWEIRDCMMWLYGCLSEDTEILTKKGWKPLHKTTKYDKIKVYDIADNIYKWETPQRWNVYRVHKNTAYCLKSDTTDQVVSKEHRCLVEREGKLVFKQAWELSKVERVPVLPQDFYQMDKGFRKLLLLLLQWKSKSRTFNKIFSKRSREEASGQRTKRSFEPCLEGRSNLFQKEGKLRQIQNKICQMPRRIFNYGTQRWLHCGTSPTDRPVTKKTSLENRGGSPQRPQSRKQFTGQSSTFQNKQSPQTTRVEVSMIQYSGLMFCPTVSTGAFVARRNGKVFITGNSGFPKSHNISKAIDKAAGAKRKVIGTRPVPGYARSEVEHGKQNRTKYEFEQTSNEPVTSLAEVWQGYGTALKPAWEIIIVAMKPLDGTFAHNAEVHGVAGLNIDGGRIGTEQMGGGTMPDFRDVGRMSKETIGIDKLSSGQTSNAKRRPHPISQGRWPANLLLSHHPDCWADENAKISCHPDCPVKMLDEQKEEASRFFYCAKCSRKERNIGLGNQPGKKVNDGRQTPIDNPYQRGETIRTNTHPTVKPLALMKYLCTLLRMPSAEQIILDPFLGSGTTGMACKELGINFIGIEKEAEYCEIAVKRIAAVEGQEITLETTLPVTKNVETFRATKDSVGGSRRPNENLPHVSESRQFLINEAVKKLKVKKRC